MSLDAYVLGVSLGNRVFTQLFAEKLYRWLESRCAGNLEILIGDSIERVNYTVRRGLTAEAAREAADRRAEELRVIFQRASAGRGPSVDIVMESQSIYRNHQLFSRAAGEFKDAYSRRGQFYNGVNDQIRFNLRAVRNQRMALERIEALATYILEELGLWYVYFVLNPKVIEVYPGPILGVKRKLFRGDYERELPCGRLENVPRFVDISHLAVGDDQNYAAA